MRLLAFLLPVCCLAQSATEAPSFDGLQLRSIGPAVNSGRIVSIAVNPRDKGTWYVGAASGGVWKTVNAGTSWTPIFEDQASYSIGTVVLDPRNPNVVWVGTGENNSQRSVAYGDGVYRSDDGGKSWKNMGLKASEHIARILIDPRDSNVVYVASQGPLWAPGGDRGLFKTTDGGKTWKNVLSISEFTGVTDVVMDPRNPDTLIAASYQRQRKVWTLIDGGPESGLHKSTDGGATWTKLKTGLPGEDLGRIGLAISPVNPDVVYATIESIDHKGGIFRSTDLGSTWERRNEFEEQGQYYATIFADPVIADRIYVMNVLIQVSDDGGKTLRNLGERSKHTDNHVIWIEKENPSHYLVGCDGGLYESYDRAANWRFFSNLPLEQFYDIAIDNQPHFYNVYGGTQDNFSVGGPVKTRSVNGIMNADWFVTQSGDGFTSKVDPEDPNTIYAELQHGIIVRYDRRTGEAHGIQPEVGKGELSLRWNWDSPFIVSSHKHTRLYFGANRLFRSEDRGDSWKAISPDLSRQIDRNKLPVMGKVWGPDAVSKNVSTTLYGTITALAESHKKDGLLYAGTDDGLVQVTEDDGANWRRIEKFPGVPEQTLVKRLLASQHDAGGVFAAFDNHKNGDFKPYLLKSSDAGKTWNSIAGDLPQRGTVYSIAEDHVNPQLLFAGTEFGLYFTVDGGKKWTRLQGGLPTIAVRDLAIHKGENDLVVATFGRGIYALDDYTPLRTFKPDSVLLPVKDALIYIRTRQYGIKGKAFQGAAFFTAENPPFGATFTYYLKEEIQTLRQRRREAAKEAEKKKETPVYPPPEVLRDEAEEEPPSLLLTISDANGRPIRTLTGPLTKGFHRVSWDLREPTSSLVKPPPPDADDDPFREEPAGPFVAPGRYQVSLSKRVGGVTTPLGTAESFNVVMEGEDRKPLFEFMEKVSKLERSFDGVLEAANEAKGRIAQMKLAVDHTPNVDPKLGARARAIDRQLTEILRALRGDNTLRSLYMSTPVSIEERVGGVLQDQSLSLAGPGGTQTEQFAIATEEFAVQQQKLKALLEGELRDLEKALDAAGAVWTSGRLP